MSRNVPFFHPFSMWDWNDSDPWEEDWGFPAYGGYDHWDPWNAYSRRGRGGRGRGRGRGHHGRRGRGYCGNRAPEQVQGAVGGSDTCSECGKRTGTPTGTVTEPSRATTTVAPQEPSNLQLWDQNFGMGATAMEDLFEPLFHHGFYRRMPISKSKVAKSGLSEVMKDDKEFKVAVDVGHFTPQELSIKTVNGYVVIEGNHEERPDEHGFVRRSFTRRYKIPEDVDAGEIKSSLDNQGHLTVFGPVQAPEERAIEMTQLGKDEVDEEEEMK